MLSKSLDASIDYEGGKQFQLKVEMVCLYLFPDENSKSPYNEPAICMLLFRRHISEHIMGFETIQRNSDDDSGLRILLFGYFR